MAAVNYPIPPTYALPIIKDRTSGLDVFNPIWLKWFLDLGQVLSRAGAGGFPGSVQHNSLTGLQGGTANEYYHLTAAQYATLSAAGGPGGILNSIQYNNPLGTFAGNSSLIYAPGTNTITANLTGNVTGNVSGTSGSTTGNAATATVLLTPRAINGVNFDGSAPITVTAAAGTLTGAALAAGVTSSSLTSFGAAIALGTPASGVLSNCTFPTLNQNTSGSSASCTGNAATATILATARAINGVNFDGSAPITVTAAAGTLTGTSLAAGVTGSSLTSLGTLGSLTVSGTGTFGGAAATRNLNVLGGTFCIDLQGSGASAWTTYTPTGQDQWSAGAGSIAGNDWGIQNRTRSINVLTFSGGAGTSTATLVGNADISGTTRLRTLGAFVAADKFVICDSSGNLHVSSLGPVS